MSFDRTPMTHKKLADDELNPLTIREEIFVNELLKTGMLTKAAVAAGYSKKNPGRIARKPHVNRVIRERMEEEADLTEKDAVMALKRSLTATVPIYRNGRIVGEREDSNAQLKAVEIMGKILGWFHHQKKEVCHQSLYDIFAD